MKERKGGGYPITPATFFAIRTPLLPFDTLLAWGEGLDAPRAWQDRETLAEAASADREKLRARLRDLVARPEVREALFIASPSLEREIAYWQDRPTTERGERIERALVRYVARMAGRPTPFGLFAGCGVGSVGARTDLRVPPIYELRRRTRLDQDFVTALTRALTGNRALRRSLRYRANESLYKAAGRLRYFEARGTGERRTYHLVAVDPNEAVEAALDRARSGASFDAIVDALVALDSDATREEAGAFVDELVDAQLLLDDLAPAVIGDPSLAILATAIGDSEAGRPVAERLTHVEAELCMIDETGLGHAPERYMAIIDELASLPVRPDPARVFQIDLVKPGELTSLSERHAREIVRGAELLRRFARPHRTGAIDRFKALFRARFEDREVPLLVALDDDVGVGFDAWDVAGTEHAPLLEGLPFLRVREENAARWHASHEVLFRKWEGALREGAREMVLDDADLDELGDSTSPQLPTGSAAVASLLSSPGENGEFRVFVRAVVGASGASLLARFADAEPALLARLQEQIKLEEAVWPEVIFAEIAHLPAGRAGNILLRPRLRHRELPILGRTQSPECARLSVADLFVSVRDERVVLRSKCHDREIVPRLTTAHNFADRSNIALYRFLCSLQFQGVAPGLSWDWGPLAAAEFLPRVVHKRIVLSRARWNLGAKRLRPISDARGGDAVFEATQTLRKTIGLPRFVVLKDGDNELPVDLDNALSVDAFTSLIGKGKTTVVEELFPGDDALAARGPDGRYVHELVVPLLSHPPAPTPIDPRPVHAPSIAPRCPPGSDWLYAKLSCGPFVADRVLEEVAFPVVRAAMQSGAASSWFFVRYDDPHWHVRLRIRGERARLRSEVQPALEGSCVPLLEDGAMWRLAFDTYDREIERYGGAEGMLAAEAIFHADSETVLSLLPLVRRDPAGDVRWKSALLGMDVLLDDFGLLLGERRALVGGLRASFAREFPTPGDMLRHRIGAAYRRRRADLDALLDPGARDDLSPSRDAFAARSARISPFVERLRALAGGGGLTQPLSSVVAALLHMHANRWFASVARAHEVVLYDFLERTHDARVARRKEMP